MIQVKEEDLLRRQKVRFCGRMAMSPIVSKVPLYRQVAELLARRIAEGVWKAGSVLPNEQELARTIGVSTGTMRKALDRLEADNLLVRQRGRGTFVIDQASEASAARFNNLRSKSGRQIVNSSALLSQVSAPADELEQARLRVAPGERVLRTTRLRSRDGRPYMYDLASLALERFPALAEGDCNVGEYALNHLAQQNGIHLGHATERVSVSEAREKVAEHLSVAPGTPLLKLDRLVLSLSGEPIEWRIGLCHLEDEYYSAEIL